MTRRDHLAVAPEPEDRQPPWARRRKVAHLLRRFASVAESGDPWSIGTDDDRIDQAPIEAAIVIVITSEGEPVVHYAGLDAAPDTEALGDVLHDVTNALGTLSMAFRWGAKRHWWAEVHHRHLDDAARRERYRAIKAAEQADHERTHPWLCRAETSPDRVCGERFRTERGLTQHTRLTHQPRR